MIANGKVNVLVPVSAKDPANVLIKFLGSTIVNVKVGDGKVDAQASKAITVLGTTIDLGITVPPSIPIKEGEYVVNLPIGIDFPAERLIDPLLTLGAATALRRNDLLIGDDAGLDRQIAALAAGGNNAANNNFPGPFGLGGPRAQGMAAAEAEPSYVLGAARAKPGRPMVDVWAEGSFRRFDDDSAQLGRHGHSSVAYVGADTLLSPYILVGALVQFDETEQTFDAASRGRDTGWMAGPYATLRLASNVFFQARAAWGRSDSTIGLDPSHTDNFDADRWLVRGTLLAQWHSGPWHFRPRASVGFIQEHQEAYKSSLGMDVPSQTVSLGQVKFGPEIAYRYRSGDGYYVEPSLLLEGIWNFEQSAGSPSIDDLAAGDKLRGRTEAGVMIYTPNGPAFGASVSFDGIGSGSYEAIGAKARVRVPLN